MVAFLSFRKSAYTGAIAFVAHVLPLGTRVLYSHNGRDDGTL